MSTLSPAAAKRVFLLLSTTRWLPVGFVVGIFALVARERGLSVEQITLYMTAQGIMVFLLELPTSGFADVLGRKPVLLVAGVVNIVSGVAYLFAHSFWQFALAAGLMGVYRALDSGPLEAWYVDSVHEHEPGADVHRAMSSQGVLVGVGPGAGGHRAHPELDGVHVLAEGLRGGPLLHEGEGLVAGEHDTKIGEIGP